MNHRALDILTLMTALMCVCAGCGDGSADANPIYVLAASSTADAVEACADRFEADGGGAVVVSVGGSNALAQQILAGAPADIFLAANERWADAVLQATPDAESHALLTNRLVIVTPLDDPANVAAPEDLLHERVRRVALAGENVPAGIYAEQALRHAGVYDALINSRRVARGGNVRLTLAFVETGEAEAGVVYATDARASTRVRVAHAFPDSAHDAIMYPAVLLTPENASARAFFEFLASDDARAEFEARGFKPVGPGSP